MMLVVTALVLWIGLAWWLDRSGRRPPPPGPYTAIVVAGCAVWPGGRPSPALERRVRRAVALYEQGYAETIVLTGGVGKNPPSEARVAAACCVAMGVPAERLIIEEQSTSTLENAAFTVGLVSGRLLVVTDAYHVPRCVRAFRQHHAQVEGAGVRGGPRWRRWRQALRESTAVVRHAFAGDL